MALRPFARVPSGTFLLLGLLGATLTACGGGLAGSTPDAGTPKPDAVTSTPDAGTPKPDAVTSTPDAGSSDIVSTPPIIAPPPMGPAIQANAIAVGHSRHACAILTDETVACWGQNTFGELGDGSSRRLERAGASLVPGLAGVRQLGIGTGHICDVGGSCGISETTCALQKDGVAKCWGPGHFGQLGNGKEGAAYYEDAPVTVALADITDLGVGSDSACAVTKAGEVWCWGRNYGGDLGFVSQACGALYPFWTGGPSPPQPTACAPTPRRIPGLTGVARVAVADGRQCALHTDGHVTCWGGAIVSIFTGPTPPGSGTAAIPTTMDGVTAVDICVTNHFGCAASASGIVTCWGIGFGGLLPLTSVTGARRLRAFTKEAIAFQADGTIRQWSSSLANPGYTDGFTDTRALDKGALDLALHEFRSCILRPDHLVRCWDRDGSSETAAPVLAQ